MKFIFPTIWISTFALGVIALFQGVFHGPDGVPAPAEMKWIFLAAWVAGTTFILWGCASLKRVRIDDSGLLVSNYWQEVRIPFGDIQAVTENCWINTHPVTIHLRRSSPFGARIVFMPGVRVFGWSSHPVVDELRTLAGLRDRVVPVGF